MKSKWIVLFLSVVLALSTAGCAGAGNQSAQSAQPTDPADPAPAQPEGVQTEEEPQEQTREEKLLASGEAGSGRAYTDLGKMYENGNGVEQDYEKALEYYILSAEAADPDFKGMRLAGLMYLNGTGVEQDSAKAAECFEAAAEAGDVSGAYFLGVLYETGNGVEQSDAEARKWYEKAVSTVDEFLSNSRNNGPDELKLALCRLAEIALAEGDTDTAVAYYQDAAALGWSAAEEALAALGAETGE